MGELPRWPKGPFPARYRWDAVAQRLAEAWNAPARAGVERALAALGLARCADHDDPFVRIFVPGAAETPVDLAAARAALAASDVYAFRWFAPERTACALGLVASADPIDATVAVGAAGPRWGIGTAAIVRFLVALRSFAIFDVDVIAEDRLAMAIAPRDASCALRIAERVLRICPPLARSSCADELARAMMRDRRLDLDYACELRADAARPAG